MKNLALATLAVTAARATQIMAVDSIEAQSIEAQDAPSFLPADDQPLRADPDPTEDQVPESRAQGYGGTSNWSAEADYLWSIHFGRLLNWFGIDNFVCSNPTPLKAFDVTKLEGAWF